MQHMIIIPNSIYTKEGTSRLLSPQHWAQVVKDNYPIKRGTWCATYENEIILYWDQRKYKRTIPIDPKQSNVASITTAPGYKKI